MLGGSIINSPSCTDLFSRVDVTGLNIGAAEDVVFYLKNGELYCLPISRGGEPLLVSDTRAFASEYCLLISGQRALPCHKLMSAPNRPGNNAKHHNSSNINVSPDEQFYLPRCIVKCRIK